MRHKWGRCKARAYGRIVDEETKGSVAIAKQDFSRILPRARAEAFTCTNIVAGFERIGILPYNPGRYGFLQEYREQQATNVSKPPSPPQSPSGARHSSSPDPDDPSTPRRRQRTNLILQNSEQIMRSPPSTVGPVLDGLHDATNELERYRTRTAIQNGRESRVFNQDELNRLREERDRKDAAKAAGHGRGRGCGCGHGRGGRGGRGRSQHIAQETSQVYQESSSDLDLEHADELLESFHGEILTIVQDDDSTSEDEGVNIENLGEKRCLTSPPYQTRSRKHCKL
ncbi:hypothetical protein K435DRAFT_853129 [Dendrothele bispora CBS 962.96]|uniref:Uncharacterized protein n=1 Tax=Dendrothele bispora (strain CBS 962.96) TaxID=1314807 RepID=A0A4S8MHX8_DENBC|nr:hypothetical protein K435DRAFT_853129 [Dendrothele bispora CBS 962.96]